MKEFINATAVGAGGGAIASAATSQVLIAFISMVFMIAFGLWGAYLRWKDSKAIRSALEDGDIKTAIEIRGK